MLRTTCSTPLWFGESAWPTDDIAVQAAIKALQEGDHFYLPNGGKASFREAICQYLETWYEQPFDQRRITVTASGMQGLALTAQALIDPGDEVLCIDPAWPNMAECFRIAGADIRTLNLGVVDGLWALDLDQLISGITSRTKAVVINSPSNPTGWVMTDSLAFAKALLHHAKVGLAPGVAFGPAGEGYLRLCYAQPVSILDSALERLVDPLSSQRTLSFA